MPPGFAKPPGMGANEAPRKKRGILRTRTHAPGPGNRLVFSPDGAELVTAGSDGLKVHRVASGDGAGGALEERLSRSDHSKPISALAVSPRGDLIATGALDHAVKLYRYPGGTFESNVTRFTLPIRCLAFSASGGMLAAAGDDEGIKVISTVDCSIVCILKGHDAPVLSISFDPKTEFLASSDADGSVIFWNIGTGKAVHVLRGAAPAVDVEVGGPAEGAQGEGAASAATAYSNTVAWHPDGGLLAVPGTRGEVKCYDRDTAEEMLCLQGGHSATVTTLAWSPSGRYLASGSKDGQVLVWDADENLDLNNAAMDAPVCSLDWLPQGNALAAMSTDGMVALWIEPVPSHMPAPYEAPSAPVRSGGLTRDELLKFDEDPEHPQDNDESSPAHQPEKPSMEHVKRRRMRADANEDDVDDMGGPGSMEGGGESDLDALRQQEHTWGGRTKTEAQAKGTEPVDANPPAGDHKNRDAADRKRRRDATVPGHTTGDVSWNLQAPFQPGSTPAPDAAAATEEVTSKASGGVTPAAVVGRQKHFLAFNLLGCITSRQDAEFAHVEIEFHDTGAQPCRVPAMVDYYGYTMAALSMRGCVLASPSRKHPRQPSTLFFRPFASWASNSDWTVRFAGEEEVRAVALGRRWVAAATSELMLRFFSDTGIQNFVLSLPGPVVTMAGHGSYLAVATHAAAPCPPGIQVPPTVVPDPFSTATSYAALEKRLEVSVYNVVQQELVWRAPLPLSPGASLCWLGFSCAASAACATDDPTSSPSTLATYDSQGIVRVYRGEFGGSWLPIFSSVAQRQSTAERHWMVGLDVEGPTSTHCLFFVVCRAPETYPQVHPRPVLSEFKPCILLANSDVASTDALENTLLQITLHIAKCRHRMEEAIIEGQDATVQEYEDQIEIAETDVDKTILRLLAAACKSDKLERALELGSMLRLQKSLQGAVRLASAMRLPALAERLHTMAQERRAQRDAAAPLPPREREMGLGHVGRAPQGPDTPQPKGPTAASESAAEPAPGDPRTKLDKTGTKHRKEANSSVNNRARSGKENATVSRGEEGLDAIASRKDEAEKKTSAKAKADPKAAPQHNRPVPNPFASNPFSKSISGSMASACTGSGSSLLDAVRTMGEASDSAGQGRRKPA